MYYKKQSSPCGSSPLPIVTNLLCFPKLVQHEQLIDSGLVLHLLSQSREALNPCQFRVAAGQPAALLVRSLRLKSGIKPVPTNAHGISATSRRSPGVDQVNSEEQKHHVDMREPGQHDAQPWSRTAVNVHSVQILSLKGKLPRKIKNTSQVICCYPFDLRQRRDGLDIH